MTSLTAFDADVLIYASTPGHPLASRIRPLLEAEGTHGIGSFLLLTEVLAKPMRRDPESRETTALVATLSRIDLRTVDEPTGRLALALAAAHGLRFADAIHLATAVIAGADRFLTNDRRDFPRAIGEIDVVYPEDLDGAAS